MWTTACPDWEDRIVSGRPLIACPPLFPDEAESALEVFKSLRIVDQPGAPTFGEVGGQWVFDIVAALFGAYDADSGHRIVSEAFVCISKKNGKSVIAALIMLTALIRNWRQSNDLIILAPTLEAAQNSFKPAADAVRADPDLDAAQNGLLQVIEHQKTIKHLGTGSSLKVLSADKSVVVGKKAGFVLVDELWEFGKSPHADAMMQEAIGGLVSRPEGFVVSITTQSDSPPVGIFKAKLEYARKVRDGEIVDPSFLPVIYEFPKRLIDSGAYLRPENFFVTNPHLGRTPYGVEWIRKKLQEETEKGQAGRNIFLAKHLNVQIGQSLRDDAWAGASYWEKAGRQGMTLARVSEESDVLVSGVDGGGLDDLLSLSVIGRHAETRLWMHWQHSWAHRMVLERRKEDATRLMDFVADGDLTIVDDMEVAFADLARRVAALYGSGKLAKFGIDPAGVGLIIEALAAEGMPTELPFVDGVRQGWQLQGAIKTAEVKVASGGLIHCAQPIMAWAVGNAKTEVRGSALMITKQVAGLAKIDPLMSLFDAVAMMSKNPEPPNAVSIYEERGLMILGG